MDVGPIMPHNAQVRMLAIGLTLSLFWLFWILRGKLNTLGLEYVRWCPSPPKVLAKAGLLGLAVGIIVSWLFRNYQIGQEPPFADILIGVSWGPLLEEVIFRGYLFGFAEHLLRRFQNPGWLIVIGVASLFAASHLAKSGITATQVATIFFTGTLYGRLRWVHRSTIPPACAHIAYNSTIYLAAFLLRRAA